MVSPRARSRSSTLTFSLLTSHSSNPHHSASSYLILESLSKMFAELLGTSLKSVLAVAFLDLRRRKAQTAASTITTSPPMPTPAPMPAFAPVDKLLESDSDSDWDSDVGV